MRRLLTFKRARTYALVLIVLYVVAWAYELSLGTPPMLGDDVPIGGDYIAFHAAGRLVLSGRGAELYDRPAVVAVQDALLGGRAPGFYDGFRNPPVFALPFVPLAVFDLLPGLAIWSLLSLACLGLAVWLFLQEVPWLKTRWRGLLVLTFAFAPIYFGIIDGENATLSLLLYVLIYRALVRDQDKLAGFWAALGLFKPQLFLVFPLILVARRRWSGVLTYALTAAGMAVVSFGLVGAGGLRAWLHIIVEPESGQVLVNTWRMVSLKSFLDSLLPGQPPGALVLYLLGSAALLGLILWCWSDQRTTFKLAWIVTSLGSVLIDPHLVDYDLTVLVPAGILAVEAVPGVRWVLVPLYVLLVLRAHLPLGDSAIQLSTLVLLICLGLTISRLRPPVSVAAFGRSQLSNALST